MVTPKFTGLKYNDDCGWYAVLNGRICQPEIDGTLASARLALVLARPAAGGFDSQPVLTQTQRNAWAAIDWRNVQPLEDDERLDNEPGYYESLTPFLY